MRRWFGMRVALMAAITWTFAIAPAQAQTQVKPGFNIFSVAQDAEIGAQSAAQVDRQLPMVNDAAVSRYVSALGAKLAAQAPGPRFNYRFRVANLSDVNAFALPGGYIYVHRGLIENSRSEGELAGVMAHEIAHVALRHPTNQVSKAYLAQAGIGILGGLLGGRSQSGTSQIVSAVGGFGLNTLFLKFSRTAESQADIAGAQIMARAGYDPNEMANFFTHMEETARGNPSKVAVFLSDHPAPADREARVRQEARLIGGVRPGSSVGSIAMVQSELRQLGPASSMAQMASRTTTTTSSGGATASVPQPASSYRLFRQRDGLFQIDQPDNWNAYNSTGYGVTFAPPGGIVNGSNGRQGIAAGVIVNHYVPFEGSIGAGYNGQSSLVSATNDLIQQVQQGNPYLQRVSGSERRLTVSGHSSYSTVLVGRSPGSGSEERITVVTSQMPDGHIMYLLLVGPNQQYAAMSPTFDHMVRSLRFNESARHD
jgi:beta-barrel assembly-enhancing protease